MAHDLYFFLFIHDILSFKNIYTNLLGTDIIIFLFIHVLLFQGSWQLSSLNLWI
jgi:hypothetical protein